MTSGDNPERDLTLSRIVKAPRAAVWAAWTDPRSFEQWWIPEPLKCRVVTMDLHAGGAFVTEMSEDGRIFSPHVSACFLAVDPLQRIVFSNLLLGGWRPAPDHYPVAIAAIIEFRDHPSGMEYSARVMHGNDADRIAHLDMGFHEGWGTVVAQLAKLVEG